MIRKFESRDLDKVMEIWLTTNIQAHNFISEEYWKNNFDMVKSMLPDADLLISESEGKVNGFVGVNEGYIAGIFVSDEAQSKGIGKQLLDTIKERYLKLHLTVYKKNRKAVNFYQRELFVMKQEQMDKNTNEIEYLMEWEK